jgi:hypothetical protein
MLAAGHHQACVGLADPFGEVLQAALADMTGGHLLEHDGELVASYDRYAKEMNVAPSAPQTNIARIVEYGSRS